MIDLKVGDEIFLSGHKVYRVVNPDFGENRVICADTGTEVRYIVPREECLQVYSQTEWALTEQGRNLVEETSKAVGFEPINWRLVEGPEEPEDLGCGELLSPEPATAIYLENCTVNILNLNG